MKKLVKIVVILLSCWLVQHLSEGFSMSRIDQTSWNDRICVSTAQAENWIEIKCNRISSYHQGHLVNLENLIDIERTGDTTLRLSYAGYHSLFEIECDSKYHTEQVMQELKEKIADEHR